MKDRMVEYQILAVFSYCKVSSAYQIYLGQKNSVSGSTARCVQSQSEKQFGRLGPNASFTSPAEQSGGRPMTRSRAHAQRSNVAPDDGPPIRRFVFARAPCVRETGAPAVGTTPAAVAFFLPHLSRKARVIFLASSLLSLSPTQLNSHGLTHSTLSSF